MHETLDSGERTPRTRGVSEWPVRRKVALVLAVPLLLAVALGGLRVGGALLDSGQASSTASQITVVRPAVAYLAAAEDAAMVFRDTPDDDRRQAALSLVRAASADLNRAARSADLSEQQAAEVEALVTETGALRDGSAFLTVPSSVDALDNLKDRVTLDLVGGIDVSADTESTMALVGEINDGRLALTQEQLLVIQRPDVLPKADLFAQLGIESAALANLDQALPDDSSVDLLRGYNSSNKGLVGIGTPELKGAPAARTYDQLATSVLDDLEATLSDSAAASQRAALLTAAVVLVALLAAVGLALLISRALVDPIRRVRDGALAVANEQLPETVARIRAGHQPGDLETIDVTTSEEMGQLARAVDDLHATAVRLAQDEAELRSRVGDMFVTLSRRNTSLVNQQLHLIERLERDEEDPERLESLFRLDHLASRMRRTAESLVVLADAPAPRSEQDSLTVTEALHAATAGVQDYQRVTVQEAPRLRISGAAAADVVHLLTELVDNALSFSPPTAPVTVTTSTPGNLLLVEVRDAGLGIEPETMGVLNQDLRTGGEVTAEATRRMGLLVVSRLARRHGITVLLEDNVDGGVTAQVFLPRPLLSGPALDTDFTAPETEQAAEPTRPAPLLAAVPEPAGPHDEAGDVPDRGGEPEPAVAAVGAVTPPDDAPEVADEGVEPAPAPDREPEPEPAAGSTDVADALSAVINANIGLPQRQPGATNGTAPRPAAGRPVRTEPPTRPQQPVAEETATVPAEDPAVTEPVADPGPTWVAEDTPEPEAADLAPEPVTPVGEDAEADEPTPVGEDEPPHPLTIPAIAHPVTNGHAVANGHVTQPAPDNYDDTPLFRMLRSSWFDGSTDGSRAWGTSEADAGWRAAERVRSSGPTQVTDSGLPVRNPGNRLVPGGVASAAAPIRRDPEAIRARLSAHAAGVARGRSAAGERPSSAHPTTETEE